VLASTTALTESRVHLVGRHCGSGRAAIGGTALAAVLWGTVGPLFTFYPAGAGIGFAFARLAVGAPVLLLLAARTCNTARWTGRDLRVALIGGVDVATLALAYAPFAHGVSTLGSPTAVTISLLEPLTAALLGVFVLSEHLTGAMAAGCALILAGLVLAVTQTRSGTAAATRRLPRT
jgi:DME family drug/metabolite transporter